MKTMLRRMMFLGSLVLGLTGFFTTVHAAAVTRVLVVTGGHGFEEAPFFQMFKDNTNITFRAVAHTNAHALLKPPGDDFDVVVFYDMWQPITPEVKTNFMNLLRGGKGLVALHHCLASYQSWDEFPRIIGGRYFLTDMPFNGEVRKASTYLHGQKLAVHVANPTHPVAKGVTDFEIEDETYGGFGVLPDSTPLLTTTNPTSTPTIAWTRQYGAGRVVYLQLGHDHLAFENPAYRRLLANAIAWTAGTP